MRIFFRSILDYLENGVAKGLGTTSTPIKSIPEHKSEEEKTTETELNTTENLESKEVALTEVSPLKSEEELQKLDSKSSSQKSSGEQEKGSGEQEKGSGEQENISDAVEEINPTENKAISADQINVTNEVEESNHVSNITQDFAQNVLANIDSVEETKIDSGFIEIETYEESKLDKKVISSDEKQPSEDHNSQNDNNQNELDQNSIAIVDGESNKNIPVINIEQDQ